MQPERYSAAYDQGLTHRQVNERKEQGLTNAYDGANKTKSIGQIFKDNLLTFFNIINAAFAVLILATGSYTDLVFLLVVIGNLIIGLVQEIASKRTLDKLSLIVAAKVTVIRESQEELLPVADLVLDDVTVLAQGDQICADGTVLHGYIEVNESLITGESDVIAKETGDQVFSGSFVVAGHAYARVETVGEDNFANKISSDAKVARKRVSQLRSSLDKILKIISIILIPIGVSLFLKQMLVTGLTPEKNIVTTVGALIGMIPEGLILLTSMSLASSAVILAYKRTLVQDLYCIETLARVDVLCLDKTGTITEGNMQVKHVLPLKKFDYDKVLANICGALGRENTTASALCDYSGMQHDYKVLEVVPFSSARKYSGVYFAEQGAYFLGSYENIFGNREGIELNMVEPHIKAGNRVLVLAHSTSTSGDFAIPQDTEPMAFIVISDQIRPEAPQTLKYFAQQDVEIKIISGDHPQTVSEIAKKAGVSHAERYVDASKLTTPEELREAVLNNSVFGRVSPQQKKDMVSYLKEAGHTVAMTGDGVNDILALRESDCSIVMASGAGAAKNIANLVLLDSNFAVMPEILAEGRKVINNINRVATLFITKTTYAVLLAVLTTLLLAAPYPFTPIQMTLISFVTIGFPSFFLAFEPNNTRVGENFLRMILQKSLPGGLCVIISILTANAIAPNLLGASAAQLSTISMVLATAVGLWVVAKVSRPFTLMRKVLFIATLAVTVFCFTALDWLFDVVHLTPQQWLLCAILAVVMPLIMWGMERFVQYVFNVMDRRKPEILQKIKNRMDSE